MERVVIKSLFPEEMDKEKGLKLWGFSHFLKKKKKKANAEK